MIGRTEASGSEERFVVALESVKAVETALEECLRAASLFDRTL